MRIPFKFVNDNFTTTTTKKINNMNIKKIPPLVCVCTYKKHMNKPRRNVNENENKKKDE